MSHTDYETTHDRLLKAEAERDALAAELASEKQQLDNALSFYPARIRDLEARIEYLRTVANTSGVRSEDMASAIYRVLSSSPMETKGDQG